MPEKKTTHRHHDPAFPAEAREVLGRIANALERIADAQETRALSQQSSNKVFEGAFQSLLPMLMQSLFPARAIAIPSAATSGPRETEDNSR